MDSQRVSVSTMYDAAYKAADRKKPKEKPAPKKKR